MKKGLMYLLVLLMGTFAFVACNDDDDEPVVPPTVSDIAKTYSADKLKAQIDGKEAPAGASVDVITSSDNSVSLKLTNIVPGVKSFTIPNVLFATQTKSEYYSTLKGAVTDNVLGYTVSAEGTVENEVLNIQIRIAGISGSTAVNAKQLRDITMKGNMLIDVMGSEVNSSQRVYTYTPWGGDTSRIKLEIQNFEFQEMPIGDITLDTLQVEKRGDVLGLQPTTRKLKLVIGEVSVDVRGAFIVEGENTSLQLSLMIDASPLTVYVDFKGKAEKESSDTDAVITVEGDAVIEAVSKSGYTYKFKVWESTPASELILTPKIQIPETATLDSIVVNNATDGTKTKIEPNTPIDFSKLNAASYVAYYVTPQDVRYSSKKLLYIVRVPEVDPVYTMESWVADGSYEKPEGLTTSNLAATFFPMFGIVDTPLPVAKADDNAALITTIHSVSPKVPNTMIPGVTAGTLFNGEFEIDPINTLKSTHFGMPYRKKPITFKVTYKYIPGTTFYKTVKKDSLDEVGEKVEYNTTEVVDNEQDQCSINAYLYEVGNFEETLDGTNINTSDKVILRASLPDGGAKSNYETLEIPFETVNNGSFDATKKYKLAIVCSSSKRGDEFMGAPGSQLFVKHLEVIGE